MTTTTTGAHAWTGTLAERGARSVMTTYARYPIELASGSGCRVTDAAGRSYLDFIAGIAVNVLGHAHPAIVDAIRRNADSLLHVSNLYWTEPMVRLAERLTAASSMDRAFFCNSGAEAVEACLKLARKARPGRPRFVTFERSFHGRTFGALSATMQPHYQDPFRPLVPGFVAVPYGDLAAAEAAIDATTSAVIVEAVQGEGGVRPAPAGFLAGLRRACDRVGALLIIDEVQTGIGRTGTFFAFQGAGVVPDAVASSKALAGGLPLGCALARGEAATALQPGDHASTFGGGPFVTSVAHAVLDVVLADGFMDGVAARARLLGRGLADLASRHEHVLGARGAGLLCGLQLDAPRAPDLVALLHARGLLAAPAGKDVLRLAPPLVVSESEIAEALASIDAALGALGGGT
jgi:predicted acetylornithine/succinylornithine family transaminase